MAQQFSKQQMKTRTSVIVFIKGASAPVILYVENPVLLYEELTTLIKTHSTLFVEKETMGPVKKIGFFVNQISAVALQDEQYV